MPDEGQVMELRKRVWDYVETHGLLRAGDRVVLGVSGGPDSLCLLDVLQAHALDHDLKLHVAHFNHALRPEAEEEAAYVAALAAERGLPFHAETADTRAHAEAHQKSLEEAARELRYRFLARVAARERAGTIAVAHTADDQAETVLMHFLRGSGLAGLRGMRPRRAMAPGGAGASGPLPGATTDDPSPTPLTTHPSPFDPHSLQLIRPLLAITRAEVEAYCVDHNLEPRRDPSNLDRAYFRNRLRLDLLPELERYNPNIRAVLVRSAEVAAGEYEVLQRAVGSLWQAAAPAEWQGGEQVAFDRARWLALTVPEQRALLREAVRRLRRNLRDVDFTPLDAAVHFSRRAGPGRRCDLMAGLRLSIGTERVTIDAWERQLPESEMPLLDGVDRLAGGWRFTAERLAPGTWSWEQVDAAGPAWCALIDAERVSQALHVRGRRPGDRFQPIGLGGHSTKLADFMINVKVAPEVRDRWPLVVSGDEIVWVAGLRVDERFKLTAETREVIRLCFIKAE